jgi:hypothetical protein
VPSFPLFIWRISLPTISCAFGPYFRVRLEPRRRERVVRERVEETVVERVERRLEVALLRENGVEARRALFLIPARRVRVVVAERRMRERPLAVLVEDLVPRVLWVRPIALAILDVVRARFLPVVLRLRVRVADPRAAREVDLRLLVAMV